VIICIERGADCLHMVQLMPPAIPKPRHVLPRLSPDWFYLSGTSLSRLSWKIISYHIISYQGFLVRPLLREPRPQVHYKSQADATAQRETQKSTNVKSLTKIE